MADSVLGSGRNIKNKSHISATDKDDDALTDGQKSMAQRGLGFLKQNNLASGALQERIGDIDNISDYRAIQGAIQNNPETIRNKARDISVNPAAADTSDILMMQAVLGLYDPEKYNVESREAERPEAAGNSGQWFSQTLGFLALFAQESVPTSAQAPEVTSEDYKKYYMNNVVLNNGNYDIHARKIWENMQETPALTVNQIIDNYLDEYAALYQQANNGQEFTIKQRIELRNPLESQITHLQEISKNITNIRPTPEHLADNFVKSRVIPEISPQSRAAWDAMKQQGLSAQDAIETQMEGQNDPALRQQIDKELQAIHAIHNAVKTYEGLTVTREEGLKILRENWEGKSKDLPDTVDNYMKIAEQKITHYQSPEGGALDSQTATARAAVDMRAIIDKERGVSEQSIVDENHGSYQADISKMESWLRDRALAEHDGGVSKEMAALYGREDQDLSRASTLDFYTGMYGGGYRLYRQTNLEQTMQASYDSITRGIVPKAGESPPQPAPEAENKPENDPTISEEIPLTVAPIEENTAPFASEINALQITLAQNFLEQYNQFLAPRKDMLASADINIESAQTFTDTLREKSVQNGFSSYINFSAEQGNLPPQIRQDMTQFLEKFNDLEAQHSNKAFIIDLQQKAFLQETLEQHGGFFLRQKDMLATAGINISSVETLLESLRNRPAQKSLSALTDFRAATGIISMEEKAGFDAFLEKFNDLESERLSALSIGESQSDPSAAPISINDGSDFHSNNPFRMAVPVTALTDETQIIRQAVTLGNAIAFDHVDGKVTITQAALAYHRLHDEDFTRELSDDEKIKLAGIADEIGAKPISEFSVNDPQLLQIISAYANDTTITALPEEWTQAFAEVSAKIIPSTRESTTQTNDLTTKFGNKAAPCPPAAQEQQPTPSSQPQENYTRPLPTVYSA
ncbi:MAG: hypothetical protein CO093_07565 [Alphaproteobacteria bacterium CG_4_9_14_3_um_filter_47_13]|nr:MAG: hypothetical protein CO093_07565 [Alphaproteobacteria bacterium CG_4_9_14_3_um_filter_47_13]